MRWAPTHPGFGDRGPFPGSGSRDSEGYDNTKNRAGRACDPAPVMHAALAHRLEERDRAGDAGVEGLGAAGHGDARAHARRPLERRRQPRAFVAHQEGDAARAGRCRRARPSPRPRARRVRPPKDGDEAPRGPTPSTMFSAKCAPCPARSTLGDQAKAQVRREQHVLHARRRGAAQERADVSRVLQVLEREAEARAGAARRAPRAWARRR